MAVPTRTPTRKTDPQPKRPGKAETRTRRKSRISESVGAAAPSRPVRAKLFQNGRSQAVRLPKEFRFEGKEVQVSRQGDGILLTPVSAQTKQQYWHDYFKALEPYRDLPFPDCEDTTVTDPEDIFAEGWV